MLYMIVKRANPKSSYYKEKIIFFYFFNFVSVWEEGCSLNILW